MPRNSDEVIHVTFRVTRVKRPRLFGWLKGLAEGDRSAVVRNTLEQGLESGAFTSQTAKFSVVQRDSQFLEVPPPGRIGLEQPDKSEDDTEVPELHHEQSKVASLAEMF